MSDGAADREPGAGILRQDELVASSPGRVLVPGTGAVHPATAEQIGQLTRDGEFFWLDLVDPDGAQLEGFAGELALDARTLASLAGMARSPTWSGRTVWRPS